MEVNVHGNFEYALKIFKEKVTRSGLFKELRLWAAFESRGARRKRKSIAARKRVLRKAKAMERLGR